MLANLTDDDVKYHRTQMERWIPPIAPAMRKQLGRISKLHGLAAIECELRLEERKMEEGIYSVRYSVDPVQWARIMTLSELWVMGAYEFVRRWHEMSKVKDAGYSPLEIEAIGHLKDKFTRVRIPLTKEEPPRLYKNDRGKAFPGYWQDGRVGWEIKEGEAITRAELADQFIETLENIAKEERDSTVHLTVPKMATP